MLISKVTPPLTEQLSKPEASIGRTNIILARVYSQTRKLRHRSLSHLPRDPPVRNGRARSERWDSELVPPQGPAPDPSRACVAHAGLWAGQSPTPAP